MDYRKTELTQFAKNCARALNQMINCICLSEEISISTMGYELKNKNNSELLLEISKRFAKYSNDRIGFDVDIAEVQDFQTIINFIIDCCEENDWFREKSNEN